MIALWCWACSLPNTVNVNIQICQGCYKAKAQYGFDKAGKSLWCSKCKKQDSINLNSKICDYDGCITRPSYGFINEFSSVCAQHRQIGMIYLPGRQCEEKDCRSLAVYGTCISKRARCHDHKLPDDFNLIEKECVNCHLYGVLDETNHCSTCKPGRYLQYVKRHENRIKALLEAKGYAFSNDCIANNNGFCRDKPDFCFHPTRHLTNPNRTHAVIVEVDEIQHRDISDLCERKRMHRVTQSFEGIPVLWIRYNPDTFKLANGIRSSKTKLSQSDRETHLIEWVERALRRVPTNLLEVVYLFYDGCEVRVEEDKIISLSDEDCSK